MKIVDRGGTGGQNGCSFADDLYERSLSERPLLHKTFSNKNTLSALQKNSPSSENLPSYSVYLRKTLNGIRSTIRRKSLRPRESLS